MRTHRIEVLIASATVHLLLAHPLCLDFTAPSQVKQVQFCTGIFIDDSDEYGGCCRISDEEGVRSRYYEPYSLSDECEPYQHQVACGECHSYSAHLLAVGSGVMVMSENFCREYVAACQYDVNLPVNFCDQHVSNGYYMYPMNQPQSPTLSPEITSSPSATVLVNDSLQSIVEPTPAPAVITYLNPYFYNLAGLIPTQMTGMFIKPDSNFWWILNQRGQIIEIENERSTNTTQSVMDISLRVIQSGENGLGEMGLLGLAFSPDFSFTNHFYINYINTTRFTTIARYTYRIGDPEGTASTEQILLQFYQPYENHNGGTMLFSPADLARPSGQSFYDLYISTGDGGSANDPQNRAQNLNTLFGKILRLRISTNPDNLEYSFPDDNIKDAVWAYGFRNPWKCSFDKDLVETPELWCADVGQGNVEEINKVGAGMNHGWRNYEGTRYNIGETIDYKKPEYEYCHPESTAELCIGKPFTGESVTGGFLYRGKKYASSYGGQYIFADWQEGSILRIFQTNGVWQGAVITSRVGWNIPSLAEDNEGELYILRYGEGANVYALPLDTTDQTMSDEDELVDLCSSAHTTESDPTCSYGIHGGNVCCPKSCGACGGFNCHLRPGGRAACCSSGILEKGNMCSSNFSPCILNY